MYFRARFMDPALGTFISPDTVVPDAGVLADYNRFAYVRGNPLTFNDPSGHRPDDGCESEGCTLPNGLEPDATWLLANGAYANVDPQITAAEDYNPVTEALLPGAAMLVGGITGGIVAGDLLLAGASLLSGWFGTAASATSVACADGDCTNEATLVFNRYISKAELDAITRTGFLRGGRPGETFFTTDYYQTVSKATQRLSLPTPPEVGIEFQILNHPVINGPRTVAPIPGVTAGGGIEYWTSDPIRITVGKLWELMAK